MLIQLDAVTNTYTFSLRLRYVGCHTTYRPDYFVRNASAPDAVRQYYPDAMPPYVEASEYSFVECKLIDLFRNQMCISQYVSFFSG